MQSNNLSSFLKRNFWDIIFVLILLTLVIALAFKNFTPGTWLLGWDDLVPELGFKLNIARSLSAVWQEYQGLGLLGGMAHAADLSRQIILLITSLILPASFLRYFWAFLMLWLGTLGTYLVVSRGFLGKASDFASRAAGLTAAAFYTFNLATVQIFYTPFETFLSFYGFLPWLLLFALGYLKKGGRKMLIIYALVSILAASAFYVQTLFVVYALFLAVFALEAITKLGKEGVLRSVKLALVTLFINAFWLLPALYFTLTGSSVTVNSHINSIATPETQFMNLARADFKDVAGLKGYWFDYYDWDRAGNYDFLYKTWITYTNQPLVEKLSIALFTVSVLGLLVSLLKKKTSYAFSLLVLLGISYFMLSGGNIAWIPLFSEIFRNVFTKWSNAAAFVYSAGLGLFVYAAADIFKNKIKYILGFLAAACLISASIYSVVPILSGNLIAKSMRVELPSYYLDTINYFQTQDNSSRIADFPLTDFWGWKFTDWGYRGSGFLWYGIPQPVLDRAFDVWSPYNEAFYNEVRHAVEAQNKDETVYVLNKYQIGYILFDGSVYEPGNPDSSADIQKEKAFLDSLSFLSKAKVFGEIIVYKLNSQVANTYISAPKFDLSSPYISAGQVGNAVVKETFPSAQGYSSAKNCDVKGQGSVAKTKIAGGNDYWAKDGGASCDYFYYPTLDYSQEYLMRITGKNISGRSLKFYLYNIKSRNADLTELLPPGNFDKSYLILPTESSSSAGIGYTLSVETRSFGKQKSENVITGIEFYPVSYKTVGEPAPLANNLATGSVKKYGTWMYKVDVQRSGLMQLGQGYDGGWKAFPTRNLQFTIFNFQLNFQVPNFKQELKHVKVNSWANGWIVPNDNISSIYIFYWPQLLEWGGGLFGILALFYLFLTKNRH